MSVVIEVKTIQEASNPELPSHFFHGCGNDYASFELVSEDDVSLDELSCMVTNTFVDVYIDFYDEENKQGSLICVDTSAPAIGKHTLEAGG